MPDFKFEIMQDLGILSESKSGWKRELNSVMVWCRTGI